MGLVLPDRRLIYPWSLHSRRKPLGACVVNWDDPITASLSNCYGYRGSFAGFANNLVTGEPSGISAHAGSLAECSVPGYGRGLRLADNSIAQIPVNSEWLYPITVFFVARVNSVDSPWGGLFSKTVTGDLAQVGMGRESDSDDWYVQTNNSARYVSSESSVSANIGLVSTYAVTVELITWPNATVKLYINGVLLSSGTLVLQSGSGSLFLASARDATTGFDSAVDFVNFCKFDRVLSAVEIAGLHSGRRQLVRSI